MKNRCAREAFRKEILVSKYYEKRFQVEIMFDKLVYNPLDTIQANFKISDPTGKAMTGAAFSYTLGTFKETNHEGLGKTDLRGGATINNIVPDVKGTLMLTIQIKNRRLAGDYTIIVPTVHADPVVNFYPEGGRLVSGLNNIMAVKATNSAGLPVIVSGEITDHMGNLLQNVSTGVAGKGRFEYIPGEDTCYFRITYPAGFSKKYALPMPEKHGFIIHLGEVTSDSIKFSIASPDEDLHHTYWVAVMNRHMVWSDNINFSKDAHIGIPIKGIGSGILQVSVFDQHHELAAERLINIPDRSEQLDVKSDRPAYHIRQRVNLLVSCPERLNHLDLAISVSLKNLSSFSHNERFNAVNQDQCSQTSFSNGGNELATDLDLLTTNYRSVYWNEVLAISDAIKPYKRHDGLSGRIFDKKENPSQHAKIRVTHIPNYRSYETQSDENGAFQIGFGSDIIDYKYLNIDAYDAMGKINLFPAVDQSYVDELKSVLTNKSGSKEQQRISDIIAYGEPDLVYVLRYGPGKFRKSTPESGKKYDPNQYANYSDVLEIVQAIKPYAVVNDKIFFDRPEKYPPENVLNSKGAIIVVNGTIRGSNVAVLKSMTPSDITNIRISTSPLDVQKYTMLNFFGVIEITTIQGMYRYRQPTFQFGTDILNTEKEFFTPDYSSEISNSVDNRKTLYWNSSLPADPGIPLMITFFASDVKGIYQCHLVGMDEAGNKVEGECTFRVE
jgi:hypothetical protein